MRNRAASLLLAVLLVVSVAPVDAAGPSEPAAPSAGTVVEVPPSADPSLPPDPSPAADPSSAPSDQPADPPAPSADPSVAPEPSPSPSTAPPTVAAERAVGGAATPSLDPAGRFIVVLRQGADVAKTRDRHAAREGLKVDRLYGRMVRGFAAKLTVTQRAALTKDPDVVAVVPDEVVQLASQIVPTGVSRVGGRASALARINGGDGADGSSERVNADVAIVDTGIDRYQSDLNVAGGVNCSTSDRNAWRDDNGHGTHVAGIVGALDNGIGVVGVAPGVRLWAVRILNADGNGLLSWYVCGLDWIAAQRDPDDPSRPLIEAVNMSVTKWGTDDRACGTTNNDVLHQAICRVVASGVTVVAAAANDSGPASKRVPASYDEVITVSALADTDGRPGGLGGHRCYSWGTYDQDDTFADFSNYGSDVDLIAPGKCIWSTMPGNKYAYMSGTSMAAPLVTGAVALFKASRPDATPADAKRALISLGTLDWKTWTDRDSTHERLLDVSRLGPLGDFSLAFPSPTVSVSNVGTTVGVPFTVQRDPGFLDGVALTVESDPGITAVPSVRELYGLDATTATMNVTVPSGTPFGRYTVTVRGTNTGRARAASLTVVVVPEKPTTYVPLGPARVLDSRAGVGLAGTFAGKTPRVLKLAGKGGIPANATAVTVNLTVVGPTAGGYVALTPTATAAPSTSTINFPAGDTRANGATVPLGSDGSLALVYMGPAGARTHLVLDVTGYFVPSGGASYVPLGPARVLDSRAGVGLAGTFAGKTPRVLKLAGKGGIPANATAVTVNLTVVGPTAGGYVALTPTATAAPSTSTINFPAGDTRANGATVPLGSDGSLALVYMGPAGARTHLVLDVTGYFVPSGGASYVPLGPARVLDSRAGVGLAGTFAGKTPRVLKLAGKGGIPANATAVTVNLTVVGPTAGGYVALTPTATAAPSTSTINFPAGDTRANGATVPLGSDGSLALVYMGPAGARTHLVLDVTGYFR